MLLLNLEDPMIHCSLQIAPLRGCGRECCPGIETYVFLDNSSDTTLCLSSLTESLSVSRTPVHLLLTLINAENIPKSGYEVMLNVLALDSNDSVLLDKVWTIKCLLIPMQTILSDEDVSQWPYLKGIKLPRLDGKKAVSILIGNVPLLIRNMLWVYD